LGVIYFRSYPKEQQARNVAVWVPFVKRFQAGFNPLRDRMFFFGAGAERERRDG
jgi:hypothetical protein